MHVRFECGILKEKIDFVKTDVNSRTLNGYYINQIKYRGADKSLARPGRKQATATEDFEFRISYLKS
jgi:hypothetical protein